MLDRQHQQGKRDRADARRHELAQRFREYLRAYSPARTVIYFEEPIALKNGETTRMLSLAAGALWMTARDAGFACEWVDIAHWKRVIVGNGGADKDEIRAWVEGSDSAPRYEEPDYYDAFAICQYGARCAAEGWRPTTL